MPSESSRTMNKQIIIGAAGVVLGLLVWERFVKPSFDK